jgi:hypothetical protein
MCFPVRKIHAIPSAGKAFPSRDLLPRIGEGRPQLGRRSPVLEQLDGGPVSCEATLK